MLPLCRHRDFVECAWLRPPHTLFNRWKQDNYNANLIGRQHNNRKLSPRQILLVTKLLIRCHEYIELGFRSTEQFAVLCACPPHILDRADREMGQPSLHDMGNRFVEENLQADLASLSKVDFENSRT